MDRILRQAVILTALALLAASVVAANVPVPELSRVPQCVPISPNGALSYQVTIVGTGGPIAGSVVAVRFTDVADTLVCWCVPRPIPTPPTWYATTNAFGVATFDIAGGGCIENGLAAIPGSPDCAGEVFADGVKMQEFGVVSPDAVDAAGRMATSSPVWQPVNYCAVGLADAVQHTTPLASSTYEWCTDITCDRISGAADAVILTPFLAGGTYCPGVRSGWGVPRE